APVRVQQLEVPPARPAHRHSYQLLSDFLQLRPHLRVGADRLGSDSRLLSVPACGEGGPAQSLRYVRGKIDCFSLFHVHGVSSSSSSSLRPDGREPSLARHRHTPRTPTRTAAPRRGCTAPSHRPGVRTTKRRPPPAPRRPPM